MNHPAKPPPLDPLEPRDEPVWLALLAAADNRARIFMRPGEAAAVLLMQGCPMQPRDAEAALDRIAATGRIERDPGGLRVCIERVVRKLRTSTVYGNLAHSAVWGSADPQVRRVWIALLVWSDDDGAVALPFDELASHAEVTRSELDAALEWLVADDRIARRPDGTLRFNRFARSQPIQPRPRAVHTEDTQHGSTQKPQGHSEGRDD